MKILFIYPDIQRNLTPQLGICMLAGIAKEERVEYDIFDLFNVPAQEELIAFQKKLSSSNPDIIAVSCRSNEWPLVQKLFDASDTKSQLKIFGGPHVTAVPGEVLDIADIAVIGEGEETFRELLRKIKSNKPLDAIKGCWIRKNGKIIKNELRTLIADLDTLPLPDWKVFDDYYYQNSPLTTHFGRKIKIIGSFEGSRGCPFSCAYCNNNYLRKLYNGKGKWRREKSPKRLIKEIKAFKLLYGLQAVFFIDEIFLTRIERIQLFKEQYISEIHLPFLFLERPENMNDNKVNLIKEAGAIKVFIGIESGDEEMRKKLLNRMHSQETIISAFKTAKKYKIHAHAFTMIGFPGETRETIFKTLQLLKQARPDSVQTTTYYPMKGTDLYDYLLQEGIFNPAHSVIDTFYGESYLNLDKEHKSKLFKYHMLLTHYKSPIVFLMVKLDLNNSFFNLYNYYHGSKAIIKQEGFIPFFKRLFKKIIFYVKKNK